MLKWLKRLFSKKPDFSVYERVQEKLVVQELALLRQEMPASTYKRRKVWTRDEIEAWRENARRVNEMHDRYWARRATA